MKNKIVSADDAVALIQDGDTLCLSGFVGTGTPEEFQKELTEQGSDVKMLNANDFLSQKAILE